MYSGRSLSDDHISFVNFSQEHFSKVYRPNAVVGFLKADGVLFEGIGNEEQFQYITKLATEAQDPSVKPSGVGAGLAPARRFVPVGPMGDRKGRPYLLRTIARFWAI